MQIVAFKLQSPDCRARYESTTERNLCIAISSAANDHDPMDAKFAWDGEVLESGFGGDGEDLLGGFKADDAFEGRNGVFGVGRDEFRDLVPRHALLLKGPVCQLLADVVRHLNDDADRIGHARVLHSFHDIRPVVRQQVPTQFFGFLSDTFFHCWIAWKVAGGNLDRTEYQNKSLNAFRELALK